MSAKLKVACFNIRFAKGHDGANRWRYRRDAVRDLMRGLDVDVFGLQEVLPEQRDFLAEALPDMRWYGVGRSDGRQKGEQSPIVVRGRRVEVEGWTTTWLSERPSVAGSRGWDAKIPRIATVLTGTLDGTPIGVVNTHFDHRGQLAQVRSARLIARMVRDAVDDLSSPQTDRALPRFGAGLRGPQRMTRADSNAEVARRRWIVTGDFNTGPESEALAELTGSGFRHVLPADAGGTFHAWSGDFDRQRIDHILVDDGWEVLDAEIRHDRPGGRLPSDHWPIVAHLRLR